MSALLARHACGCLMASLVAIDPARRSIIDRNFPLRDGD